MKLLIAGSYRGGYRTVIDGLATVLTQQGIDINVLGTHYDGSQLDVPYDWMVSNWEYMLVQRNAIQRHMVHEQVLLVGDIPNLLPVLKNLEWKPACLFPVESDPLHQAWVTGLAECQCFTFTRFGEEQCRLADLSVVRIGIGLDPFWSPDTRELAREILGLPVDQPIILTVSDNQFRKGLPIGLKAISELPFGCIYVVVTTPGEWDLMELAERYRIQGEVIILDSRTIGHRILREYYRAADLLLSTSMAEGIGFPLYEAQACGTPVVAVRSTSVSEAVRYGELVEPSQTIVSTFGNTRHYLADSREIAKAIVRTIGQKTIRPLSVKFDSWEVPAQRLWEALQNDRHRYAGEGQYSDDHRGNTVTEEEHVREVPSYSHV